MPVRPEGMSSPPPPAIPTLIQCFAQPLHQARTRYASGDAVVGAAAHTVPWEILRAAGLSPVVVRPTRPPAHFCEEFLEPGIFSRRIRGLFESLLTGDLSFLSAFVLTRTSEQDYKAYLYLRELAREGRSSGLPSLWFYDLLHSPSPHAYEYGLARTRELVARLGSVTGHAIRTDTLEAAVAESNAARAAVRRLLALRRNRPRLTGCEALALVGSFFLTDRTTYSALANRAADEADQRAPLSGPRLVLAGAWLDDDRLHVLIESHGAVIVAEDGCWGSRSAGHDIEGHVDFVAAIFDKYYRDGPSVRQFPAAHRAWFHDLDESGIDGVVFYLPPEDSVMGWDVPLEQRRLDALHIPTLVIRDDVGDPGMPERCYDPIKAFVERAARGR